MCCLFGRNEWVTLLFHLILCWASPEVSLGWRTHWWVGGPFTRQHQGSAERDKTPLSWSWQPAPGHCPFSAAPPPDKRRIPCFVPWVSTSWGEERKKEKSKSESKKVNTRRWEAQDSKERREERKKAGYRQQVGKKKKIDSLCNTVLLVIISSLSRLNKCARTLSTHYTTWKWNAFPSASSEILADTVRKWYRFWDVIFQ